MFYGRLLHALWLIGLALLVDPTAAAARQFPDPFRTKLDPLRLNYCIDLACSYEQLGAEPSTEFFCFGQFCPTDRFAYTQAFTSTRHFYRYCLVCSFDLQTVRRASRDDPAIVPYLLDRFEQAPRAGQIYIALVIRNHDRIRGEQLLRQFSMIQNEWMLVWDDHVGRGGTVGQLAQWCLEHSNFVVE